jgi:heme oxygenase
LVTAHALLRAQTADLHAELDRLMAPLLANGSAGYADFLQRSAAAVFPLETLLAAAHVQTVLPDWPLRIRGPVLRLDLRDLGVSEPSVGGSSRFVGEAFLFGVLYVLEGSRLGAKALLAEMKRGEDFPSCPTRYLAHGQGQPLWPSFLARLNASAAVRDRPQEAIAGAVHAFEVFLAASEA